jgi:hypothetical protein
MKVETAVETAVNIPEATTLHSLSKDIISYIGTFLETDQDVRNCLEASRVFSSIAHASKYHILTCIKDVIDNIHKMYSYIKRIKPTCDVVFVMRPYWYDNEGYDMKHFLELLQKHSDIILQLAYSKTTTILPMLPSGTRVRMTTSFLTIQEVINMSKMKCEYVHTMIDDDNAFLLKQYCVCNIPKIELHVASMSRMPIDLSCINMRVNKELNITYTGCDFHCIDPHKVTSIEEHVVDHGRSLERFFASCVDDPLFHTSRMRRVYIYRNTRVTHHNIWLRFVRILPQEVEYCVAIHDPSAKDFITRLKECGATRIRYLCYNKDTLLNALMISRVFVDHVYPLELTSWCKAKSTTYVQPICMKDIYMEMTQENKKKWSEYIPHKISHIHHRSVHSMCKCM